MAIDVTRDSLGNMDLLAEGGQGKIYKLTHFRLPDCPGGVVYKEYKDSSKITAGGLTGIVGVRSRMSQSERDLLDRYAVWPVRTVSKNGSICGILMPIIPPKFVQTGTKPNGQQMRAEREVQFLFISPEQAQKLGHGLVNLVQRLRICLEYARGLEFLASRDVVFGDISAKNALYTYGSGANDIAVVMVDCDAVRVTGNAAAVEQLNSPDWDPPGTESKHLTKATDVYKFALFVIRVLSPGANASVSRNPKRVESIFDKEGKKLLASSLADNPKSRPSMHEWLSYLERYVQSFPTDTTPALRTAPAMIATTNPVPNPTKTVPATATNNPPAKPTDGRKLQRVGGKWQWVP